MLANCKIQQLTKHQPLTNFNKLPAINSSLINLYYQIRIYFADNLALVNYTVVAMPSYNNSKYKELKIATTPNAK